MYIVAIMSWFDDFISQFKSSDDLKAEKDAFEKIKVEDTKDEIKVDLEKEETETPTLEEIKAVIESSQEDSETKAKLDKALKALSAAASEPSAKVYSGQNLMGTPSSMSPYGPMANVGGSPSPAFAGLDTYFGGKLKSIEGQLEALRNALKKGANV